MRYFTNISTIEELKKAYRILIKKNHPDNGGDTATAAAINNEYEKLFNELKAEHNKKAAADSTGSTKEMHETPEQFRAIIEKIIHLDGITIELCGSWIWVSGDTMTHKEVFKTAGLFWAKQKKMWYWRCAEDAAKTKKTASMDYIRTKYGSDTVAPKSQPALAI
ncbi:MAG: J domain-containing protein [Anaerotignaceae bacterium]